MQGKIYGLMNKTGEIILPAQYVNINEFNENRILVQSDYSSATLLDENFKVTKEFKDVLTVNSEDLGFRNGLCPIYINVGPMAKAKDENVQKFGGISKMYVNPKGEIIWKDEPYHSCFPK